MLQKFSFEDVQSSAYRTDPQIEDVLPQGAVLDFADGPISHRPAHTPRSACLHSVSAEFCPTAPLASPAVGLAPQ